MKIMSTFCQEVKAITSDITKFDSWFFFPLDGINVRWGGG
jgi:hypothetical protein